MNRTNTLMETLGIRSSDPIERFWENPCGAALREVGKAKQTDEMIVAAIKNDPGLKPFLKYVSKRKLTYEICLASCRKCGWNIQYVPSNYLDREICISALTSTPLALEKVPEELVTPEMCKLTIGKDATGHALKYIPSKFLEGEYGRKLCQTAVKNAPEAIQFVPEKHLTEEMLLSAVERSPMTISLLPETKISQKLACAAVERTRATYTRTDSSGVATICEATDWPIAHIPEYRVTQQMVKRSLELCPKSIGAIPESFLSNQICLEIVSSVPSVYRWLPEPFKTVQPIIDTALVGDIGNIHYVPMESNLSRKDYNNWRAFENDRKAEREAFEAALQSKYRLNANVEVFNYDAKALDLPEPSQNSTLAYHNNNQVTVHETIAHDEPDVETIYYISDVHLCHQVELTGKSSAEIVELLKEKTKHLVNSLTTERGTIIVDGDVADSIPTTRMFYQSLVKEMESKGLILQRGWRIFAILGNHELWDGDPEGKKPARPIDEVIESYRKMFQKEGINFVQNDLFIDYKRNITRCIDEQTLLEADEKELREVLAASTLIILGGIGFSGLNPHFNAETGIYGAKPGPNGMPEPRLSRKEENKQSERFCALYKKLLRCAGDQTIIIATHMPMSDWSSMPYNPNWIYINGHTHQNSLIRSEDGTTVLADNQIGYKPKPWHFNAFTYQGRYDPFDQWGDGIYDISEGQYKDFNNGRGIALTNLKWEGQIYMVKRNNVYMFFLQSKNLLILAGKQRILASHSIEYYYKNLPLYQRQVKKAFEPYHRALVELSDEIKTFGGTGAIHGCIVDIDWGNHIYLNPFDGKITPYFALDMTNKLVFDSISALLSDSPSPPSLPNGNSLSAEYNRAIESNKLPIFSALTAGSTKTLATVPELVLDRSMYKPSRIMRSIQYIFEQDVVRVWNDAIISRSMSKKDKVLPKLAEGTRQGQTHKALTAPKPASLTAKQKLNNRAKQYAKKIQARSNGRITIDPQSYIGGKEKINARCLECGHKWMPRADKLLARCYCPKCRKKHV